MFILYALCLDENKKQCKFYFILFYLRQNIFFQLSDLQQRFENRKYIQVNL